MSLMHDALKKLEEGGGGGNDGPAVSASRGKGGCFYKIFVAMVVFIASLAAAAATLYLFKRMGVGRWAPDPVPINSGISEGKDAGHSPAPRDSLSEGRMDGARAHNLRGIKAYMSGDLEDALANFEKAIDMFPAYAEAHNNIALVYERLGEREKATDSYRTAIELRPDYPEALNNLGVLIDEDGNTAEAVELYRRASDIDPSYPDPYLNMAISYEKAGSLRDAISSYEAFISRTDPDSEVSRKLTRKVTLMKALYLEKMGG